MKLILISLQGAMERFDEIVDSLLPLTKLAFRFRPQGLERRFGQIEERFIIGFERVAGQRTKRLGQFDACVCEQTFLFFETSYIFFYAGFGDRWARARSPVELATGLSRHAPDRPACATPPFRLLHVESARPTP